MVTFAGSIALVQMFVVFFFIYFFIFFICIVTKFDSNQCWVSYFQKVINYSY